MYDYVIVGGGSAGCVLANRLSKDPANKVCLLEAGPADKSLLIDIPFGIAALMWDPRHNWKYYSEPEPFMNNREMYQPRGKVLGGSSAINAMIYMRGVADDYDEWESLGNPGWGWKDVFPYFKASEKQQRGASEYHGDKGTLSVVDPHHRNPVCDEFIKACDEINLAPLSDDFNGAEQEGIGYYQVTQDGKGKRCSAAKAFLPPEVRQRPNLEIITGAFANKLILEGKKVVGVEYSHKRKVKQALASKEVLLSAGAINSPQLLMLSGIGPKAELDKHGINVVHELPGVGENLQDHLDIVINARAKGYQTYGLSIPYLAKGAVDIMKYIFNKGGFLASNTTEAGGFIKSKPELKNPDIQVHFTPALLRSHFLRNWGHGFSLHMCNLRPKSRGSITLKSADPKQAPAILFNYVQEKEDMDVLIECVKISRRIIDAPALKAINKGIFNPEPNVQSDEEIAEFIRNNAETIYHPVGSCKMGNDDMAVVDSDLKVHGIENLRVIDASIMPVLIGGNTNAPSMMIAQKGADKILSESLI